jgi:hypothetical protein
MLLENGWLVDARHVPRRTTIAARRMKSPHCWWFIILVSRRVNLAARGSMRYSRERLIPMLIPSLLKLHICAYRLTA